VLVEDAAVAADDERLRHAVHTPLDGGPPVAVHAHGNIGVAVAAEETARRRRLVLVVDAVDAHARALPERHQQRVLLHAGPAPGGPEVDHRDLARGELGAAEAADGAAIRSQALE